MTHGKTQTSHVDPLPSMASGAVRVRSSAASSLLPECRLQERSVDASPAKCVAAAAHNTTPISQAATDVDSQAGSQVDSNPSTMHSSSSGGAMILLEDSETEVDTPNYTSSYLTTPGEHGTEAHSTITSQSAASVTKTR